MRRFLAMIGIAVVLALALALMWQVYLHRERSRTPPDEPTLVRGDLPQPAKIVCLGT